MNMYGPEKGEQQRAEAVLCCVCRIDCRYSDVEQSLHGCVSLRNARRFVGDKELSISSEPSERAAFTPSVRLADIPTTIEVVPSNKVDEELPDMSCNVFQMDVFARIGRARCIIRRDARDAFLL